ncbi:MAG: hypothetical protein AAB581_00910 [Patescibacteria group bacterium]
MSNAMSDDVKRQIQEKLQHLVGVAFESGIAEAVRQARAYNDPFILDAFHDAVVDKLYQELVARHKIDELQ